MGAKEISVIGMDGLQPADKEGQPAAHSFEEEKLLAGTVNYDVYRRHYVMLWDYLINDLKEYNVKFKNLGEGHPSNQSTDVSEQMFPLEGK